MRVPSHTINGQGQVDAMLTPMIDVVFLLLVFFVWTASFRTVELVLPSQLAARSGTMAQAVETPPPEADFNDIVIRVFLEAGQVRWTLNNQPVATMQALKERLTAVARIKRDAPVIVHPDAEVPLGEVIALYDVAREAGFQRVQFATHAKL